MNDPVPVGSTVPSQDATSRLQSLIGMEVVDLDGGSVGTCERVFWRTSDGTPEWCAASTGLIDKNLVAVPLVDARIDDEKINVPYPKEIISDAPAVNGGPITLEREMNWYRHYNIRRELSGATDAAVPNAAPLATWPDGADAQGRSETGSDGPSAGEREPSQEAVRERAYEIYLERGGEDGLHEDDWRKAEAELRGRSVL
jgi:hypothetical protein